jgi:hypothetical protein
MNFDIVAKDGRRFTEIQKSWRPETGLLNFSSKPSDKQLVQTPVENVASQFLSGS